MSQTLHIVIFRTGGIGDVILSSVALSRIFSQGRPVTVYWVGYPPKLELIAAAWPQVIPIVIDGRAGYRENLRRINERVEQVDVVLDLQRSPRTLILSRLLVWKFRAKFQTWNKGSWRRSLIKFRARWRSRERFPRNLLEPTHQRHALMARAVDRVLGQLGEGFPALPFRNNQFSVSDLPLQSGRWVAVAAGALHATKRAPVRQMVAILKNLPQHGDPPGLIFLGDAADAEISQQIIDELSGFPQVLNRCGQTTLVEAAHILRRCEVLLANDTALAHLAEAVGTDVAMLFGPTVEAFGYAPWRPGSRAFSAEVGCRPCTKGGGGNCRFDDFRCFAEIDERAVGEFLLQKIPTHGLAAG